MKQQAELVFVPTVGMGHLVAVVEMAKLLVARDDRLSVTVLIMNIRTMSKPNAYIETLVNAAPSTSLEQRIKYVDLSPHNNPDTEADPGLLKHRFIASLKPHVRNAVADLAADPDTPRLAGLVIDMFCTTMIDVANEFSLPTYMFYTSGIGFLGLMFHLQKLHDEAGLDPTDFKHRPNDELAVPGFFGPIPGHAMPAVILEQGWAQAMIEHARRTREIKGVMVNSFDEFEAYALQALRDANSPPVYAVGPIINVGKSGGEEVMTWLDGQPVNSVVFLCFGSLGGLPVEQVREIARALEMSEHRFLWALREKRPKGHKRTAMPTDYADPAVVLPEGFLDRTAERGRVIGWAPQAEVLSHVAVGGFVSHCGWNSVLESLFFGVPIAAWPLYAEQHTNAFQLLELGLAEKVTLEFPSDFYCDENETRVLDAETIEGAIGRVMVQDSPVRKRVREMSEKSREALSGSGGSSRLNLDRLIDDILRNLP